MGVETGSEVEPHTIFTGVPLDCKESPFLNVKVHSKIGHILYEIIH